jgi:hypothetical protein
MATLLASPFYSVFLLLWALNHLSDFLFTQERDLTIVDPLGGLNNLMMLTGQRIVSPHQNPSGNTSRDPQGRNLIAALTVGKDANLHQNLKYTRGHIQERNLIAVVNVGGVLFKLAI